MNQTRVKMVGEFLRQRRLELGWSARRVGRLSGVNYQTALRIENAEFTRPSIDKIKAIAEAMEMNL
jgi:transcriptional regulator with XRE-family HTH domain